MNKNHLILVATLLLSLASVQAGDPDPLNHEILYGRRCTFKDNSPNLRTAVWRQKNRAFFSGIIPAALTPDAAAQLDREKTQQALYPEATLLVSGTQYKFRRNCHDFAWGPWMHWEGYPNSVAWDCGYPNHFSGPNKDTFGYGVLGPQKEAWTMSDAGNGVEYTPRQNWLDGSFDDAVQSQYRPGEEFAPDFLFATSDLNSLQYEYPDMLGSMSGILQSNPRNMIGLPVCDLADVNTTIPEHSAVLVDWFTPAGIPSSFCAGIYVSKWGDGGVWLHRWGYGLCPDDLFDFSEQLHVFAPSTAWGGMEYWVCYSFW